MVDRPSFGRRASANTLSAAPSVVPAPAVVARQTPLPAPDTAQRWNSRDHELEAWKQARRGGGMIPWRQLSLMASLCFGIASFVLPDDVNRTVNWLLYGLMAVSFIAGIRKRSRASPDF